MKKSQTKEIKLNNHTLKLIVETDADESVFNEILKEREYQNLENIIRNAKYPIIDIGAHIGIFACFCRLYNGNTPIFCYEPEPRNFEILKKNIKLNNFQKIFPKQLAVTGHQGSTTLYVKPDSHNHSIIPDNQDRNLQEIPVNTITLNKILQKILTKSPQIDLLKMDCEGAEFQIFENTDLKLLQKVQNVFIEYHEFSHNPQIHNIIQKLQKAGFKNKKAPSHYQKNLGFILATQNRN